MAIYKIVIDNQLYVYMNGALIYKRWLSTGQSLVFDVMAYDKYTLLSIIKKTINDHRESINLNE